MSVSRKRFVTALIQNRPLALLGSLALLLLLHPFLGLRPWMGSLLQAGFTLVVLASATALYEQRKLFWTLVAMAIPAMLLGWLSRLGLVDRRLGGLGDGCFVLVLLIVITGMIRSLFLARRVTGNMLYRAVSVYLMLGLAFATVFGIVCHEAPDSLHGIGDDAVWMDLVYFSFSTLTTLGYGDITPTTSLMRALAAMEATVGPMFLAIVVARLVAMYSVEHREEMKD